MIWETICAIGAASFLTFGGMALLEWVKRPRHQHEWEVFQEVRVFDPESRSGRPTGTRYVLQCKTCGDLKTKKQGAV